MIDDLDMIEAILVFIVIILCFLTNNLGENHKYYKLLNNIGIVIAIIAMILMTIQRILS